MNQKTQCCCHFSLNMYAVHLNQNYKKLLEEIKSFILKFIWRELSGGPVVRTWCFHCQGLDSVPHLGTKILQALRHSQ